MNNKPDHYKQGLHPRPKKRRGFTPCLVKAIFHRPILGKFKTVTVSKNKAGQYFASILFEDDKEKPKPSSEGKNIGIDLGLTHFAITSEGSKFDNPRWIVKHERNLKIKQQQLSRKQKGSNNRALSKLKVAKVHLKIANCRSDFHALAIAQDS